jgi:hypothetical protein
VATDADAGADGCANAGALHSISAQAISRIVMEDSRYHAGVLRG